jgi:hypothetical protein
MARSFFVGRICGQGLAGHAVCGIVFFTTSPEARKHYREFVERGVGQGKKPELVRGGLIRSMGG